MLNIRRFQNGLQIVPSTGGATATTIQGELAVDNSTSFLYYNDGTTSSSILTASQQNTVTNKNLIVNSIALQDGTDNTKQTNFSLSGAVTATETTLNFIQSTNRSVTFPDASGFVVVSGSGGGIITNNLLDESSVWFVDHTDNTKAFKFNVSGASTGTSMTLQSSQTSSQVLTLPNTSDTLVARNTTDTLTNKTLTSPVLNTPTADTITGISGGPLTIQSASNEDLDLTAQGSGNAVITGGTTGNINLVISGGQVINIDNIQMYNGNIIGPTNNDLTIESGSPSYNINLNTLNASALVKVGSAAEFKNIISLDQTVDSTTTGSATTLTAFTTSFVEVTNASLTSVSAIPAGANGQVLILSNDTSSAIVLNNEDAGVTAANRITTGTGFNLTVNNNSSVSLIYDPNTSRWKVYGGAGGGSPPTLFGTRASPELITGSVGLSAAATNMSVSAINQVIFIAGNGGPVNVTAIPQIQAGTIIGQTMTLVGRNNTNTVTFTGSSNSVELNGGCTLGGSDCLNLVWDGTVWVETSRS